MSNSKRGKTLKQNIKQWEQDVLAPHLKKFPEKRDFDTVSGIEVKQLYTPDDIKGLNYETDLGFPGQYPFTRGVIPNMYRSRYWIMGQYAGYGSAADANRRYKYLIEQGQNGFGIAFDLPTQLGYDSDNALSAGQVGQVGVAISTLDDIQTLLDGIPLDKIQIRVIANAPAAVVLAMIVVEAQRRGFDLKRLRLALQNDILKEYTSRGNYIFPPAPSMRLFADVLEYCTANLPSCIPIYFCGYHLREAGANAVQEVAFTLANAIDYIKAGIARGLHVNDFGPRLMLYFGCHRNFFEEVAKIRAARRMWAQIMKTKFHATNPEACKLHVYATSQGSTLTAHEPHNNIIRVTLQALAGVLGGAEVMHLASMDEALAIPTEESVRIAVRTQQIIAEESGVADTADPLGGGYFIESLTNTIQEKVNTYLDKIEEMGGALKAIEKGYIQREIMDSSYRSQMEEESGKRTVIGVNRFKPDEEIEPVLFKVDPAVEHEQKERLQLFKTDRNRKNVDALLEKVCATASTEQNLMPALIEAVKGHATLGEICDALRDIFGIYEGGALI